MQHYKTPLKNSNVLSTRRKLNQSLNSLSRQTINWRSMYTLYVLMFSEELCIKIKPLTHQIKREVSYFNSTSIHCGYIKEVKVQLQTHTYGPFLTQTYKRHITRAGSSSLFTSVIISTSCIAFHKHFKHDNNIYRYSSL